MVQLMILLHSNVLITEYTKDLKAMNLKTDRLLHCRTVVVIIPVLLGYHYQDNVFYFLNKDI